MQFSNIIGETELVVMHLISFCLSKFVLLILGIVRILFIKRRGKKKKKTQLLRGPQNCGREAVIVLL